MARFWREFVRAARSIKKMRRAEGCTNRACTQVIGLGEKDVSQGCISEIASRTLIFLLMLRAVSIHKYYTVCGCICIFGEMYMV